MEKSSTSFIPTELPYETGWRETPRLQVVVMALLP